MIYGATKHWEECSQRNCACKSGQIYVCECNVALAFVRDAPRADADFATAAKALFARRSTRALLNLITGLLVGVGTTLFFIGLIAWRHATYLQLLFALFPCIRGLLALDIFTPLVMNTHQIGSELFADYALCSLHLSMFLIVVPILFVHELMRWVQVLSFVVYMVAIAGSYWLRRREIGAYLRGQTAHAVPLASES